MLAFYDDDEDASPTHKVEKHSGVFLFTYSRRKTRELHRSTRSRSASSTSMPLVSGDPCTLSRYLQQIQQGAEAFTQGPNANVYALRE